MLSCPHCGRHIASSSTGRIWCPMCRNGSALQPARPRRGPSPALTYEEDLPDDMPDKDYDEWFKASSLIYGVRMGPVYPPNA
jgi:uncharacterized Zn finger protein (UPF0148 family)